MADYTMKIYRRRKIEIQQFTSQWINHIHASAAHLVTIPSVKSLYTWSLTLKLRFSFSSNFSWQEIKRGSSLRGWIKSLRHFASRFSVTVVLCICVGRATVETRVVANAKYFLARTLGIQYILCLEEYQDQCSGQSLWASVCILRGPQCNDSWYDSFCMKDKWYTLKNDMTGLYAFCVCSIIKNLIIYNFLSRDG